MVINFFACITFVFNRDANTKLLIQFMHFMSGILLFRFMDWMAYSLLVDMLSIHYLIIQLGNVVIFSIVKFGFARRVIEGRNIA